MNNFCRNVSGNTLIHCYQNTANGAVLFYNTYDFLVYFTIFCTSARKYGVRVLSLCQMPDHIHAAVTVPSLKVLSLFMCHVSASYAKSDSFVCHRAGKLFNSFGAAPKPGRKRAVSTLVYIGNNPVERQLCRSAADYRWNYLTYGTSSNPFSDRLVVRSSSYSLRRALAELDGTRGRDAPVRYNMLRRLFEKLGDGERQQLTDYIINLYSAIDYGAATDYFGNYRNMLGAMACTTGGEFDIEESFIGRTDKCYGEVARWVMESTHCEDIHELFVLEDDARRDLMFNAHQEFGYDLRQLAKFFRLPLNIR